jgi:hypothetical protein
MKIKNLIIFSLLPMTALSKEPDTTKADDVEVTVSFLNIREIKRETSSATQSRTGLKSGLGEKKSVRSIIKMKIEITPVLLKNPSVIYRLSLHASGIRTTIPFVGLGVKHEGLTAGVSWAITAPRTEDYTGFSGFNLNYRPGDAWGGFVDYHLPKWWGLMLENYVEFPRYYEAIYLNSQIYASPPINRFLGGKVAAEFGYAYESVLGHGPMAGLRLGAVTLRAGLGYPSNNAIKKYGSYNAMVFELKALFR